MRERERTMRGRRQKKSLEEFLVGIISHPFPDEERDNKEDLEDHEEDPEPIRSPLFDL